MKRITAENVIKSGCCAEYHVTRINEIFAGRETLGAKEVKHLYGLPATDRLWALARLFIPENMLRELALELAWIYVDDMEAPNRDLKNMLMRANDCVSDRSDQEELERLAVKAQKIVATCAAEALSVAKSMGAKSLWESAKRDRDLSCVISAALDESPFRAVISVVNFLNSDQLKRAIDLTMDMIESAD